MYQCSKKLVTYKKYFCFDHSDFSAHAMFTFDVCWGSLGTSIFGDSSSAPGVEKTMICSIKIQSENIKMTWSISLFPFGTISIFLNVMALAAIF